MPQYRGGSHVPEDIGSGPSNRMAQVEGQAEDHPLLDWKIQPGSITDKRLQRLATHVACNDTAGFDEFDDSDDSWERYHQWCDDNKVPAYMYRDLRARIKQSVSQSASKLAAARNHQGDQFLLARNWIALEGTFAPNEQELGTSPQGFVLPVATSAVLPPEDFMPITTKLANMIIDELEKKYIQKHGPERNTHHRDVNPMFLDQDPTTVGLTQKETDRMRTHLMSNLRNYGGVRSDGLPRDCRADPRAKSAYDASWVPEDHNSSLRNAAMDIAEDGNVDLEAFAKKYYEAEDKKTAEQASKPAGHSSAK